MIAQVTAEGLRSGSGVLDHLRMVCLRHGLEGLAARLTDLAGLVREDMALLEASIQESRGGRSLVDRSAGHMMGLAGKRLRPMCVALASRLGSGFNPAARELAVAVELVHCATLLHDDVVDLSDCRRGAPAARTLYGNAASIFAGDWLLVEALRRVRRAGVPGTLDRVLAVIEEMIFAESLQLEGRGRIHTDREVYFRIIEGKTASLFRWAMMAGGRAGGLEESACAALERFGLELGRAFQVTDDLLDLTGETSATGKALFTDLREGKMTLPLIVALEREPSLRVTLEAILAGPEDEPPPAPLAEKVLAAIHRNDVAAVCRETAMGFVARAMESLEMLPAGRARTALATVAEATVSRER